MHSQICTTSSFMYIIGLFVFNAAFISCHGKKGFALRGRALRRLYTEFNSMPQVPWFDAGLNS